MTIAEIERRILEIRACAEDDEAATSLETSLRDDFIAWLCLEPQPVELVQQMARLVLSTSGIEFYRGCA